MATRLNIPHPIGAGAPDVSPAFDAGWDFTDFASRIPIGPRAYNTPRANGVPGLHRSGTTDNMDVLFCQLVSDPLAEQTISGTVIGVLPCRENNIGANARAQMKVRVCSSDGTSFRGTLLDFDTVTSTTNELTTSAAPLPTIQYPRGRVNTTLSSVDAQAGDRLVIELGVRCHTISGTDFTFAYQPGDDVDLADCADNESGTTGSPWVEFSQDLAWGANYTVSSTTISPGDLAAAIVTARAAGTDVIYLEAGTYTYGVVTTDTTGTKMLRVRAVEGLTNDDVSIEDGARAGLTNTRYLSFENLSLKNGAILTDTYRVQMVGCKIRDVQFERGCTKTLIDNCDLGGIFGLLREGYDILASGDTTNGQIKLLSDTWVLRSTFSGNMNNTYFRFGTHFDKLVVDGCTIETAERDVRSVQIIETTGTGTFTLTYAGQTTSALAHNASFSTVQTALRALSTIGSGGVVCSNNTGGGGLTGAGVLCEFSSSLVSDTSNVVWPTETLTYDATGLGGGTVDVTLSTKHTDGFRTFTSSTTGVIAGTGLRFHNNYIVGGEYQGFFINGGSVTDVEFTNNIIGQCSGSFRALAIDDDTKRFFIANNTFADASNFAGSSTHTTVVLFNNLFTNAAAFSKVAGTSMPDLKTDYNVFGGGRSVTGTAAGANDLIDVPPSLVDTVNGDYRMESGSAGENFGTASYQGFLAPTTDHNGNPRSFPCEAGALEGVV